jgi:3',5'-cyclic AMP phosphodiesterase CpdA
MATKTNTTRSVNDGSTIREEAKRDLDKALAKFKDEKPVKVKIPANLKNKIGETLFLSINGVSIVLPVDGSENKVPESFANHLQEYLANVQY